MESNVNICINLKDGSVSISGSEEFVSKNMETVFDFVMENLNLSNKTFSKTPEAVETSTLNENSSNNLAEESERKDKYITAGIYHVDPESGDISILKKIPGNSKAEKMKNIALIALYVKQGKIEGRDLVPLFEKHACYDSSNCTKIFKSELSNMIYKPNGKKWTLELTQPGQEAAIALLEEMTNDKK